MDVLYLCDGKACGDECPNDMCRHTRKLEHALNKDAGFNGFEKMPLHGGSYAFVETDDGE